MLLHYNVITFSSLSRMSTHNLSIIISIHQTHLHNVNIEVIKFLHIFSNHTVQDYHHILLIPIICPLHVRHCGCQLCCPNWEYSSPLELYQCQRHSLWQVTSLHEHSPCHVGIDRNCNVLPLLKFCKNKPILASLLRQFFLGGERGRFAQKKGVTLLLRAITDFWEKKISASSIHVL